MEQQIYTVTIKQCDAINIYCWDAAANTKHQSIIQTNLFEKVCRSFFPHSLCFCCYFYFWFSYLFFALIRAKRTYKQLLYIIWSFRRSFKLGKTIKWFPNCMCMMTCVFFKQIWEELLQILWSCHKQASKRERDELELLLEHI